MREELETLASRFREALSARPAPPPRAEPAAAPVAARAATAPTVTHAPTSTRASDVTFVIAPKVRCDLLAYSGQHCGGQLMLVRVLPHADHDGDIDGNAFQSIMIAGPHGTRVTFATHAGDDWQDHPWRAIVLTKKHTFTARNGKPAVRIPDLETLDPHDARRAEDAVQVSYPHADSLDTGEGWTYGRPGRLRNRVRQILIDKV